MRSRLELKVLAVAAAMLSTGAVVLAQNSKLSQFTKQEPPCGITLRIIEQRKEPVIAKGMPGTEHNKYGFEGGCVIKLDGVYHLFTSEMVGDPVHDKMMLGHWTSPDGLVWTRRDTMFESSGSRAPNDIRSALWAPMPVYNEEEGRWNVFYVSYTPRDYGRLWRAVSRTKGREGINGPWQDVGVILEPDREWEGVAGCDSIFPYPVDGKWMAFYGSADHRTWWSAGLLSAERLAGPWKRENALNPVTLSGVLGTENPVVTRLKSGRYVAVFDTLKNKPAKSYQQDGYLIGYADSADGAHWSAAKQMEVDCTKLWVSDIRTPLGLVEESDGMFTMFYTGFQRSKEGESKGWREYRNVGMLKLRLSVNETPHPPAEPPAGPRGSRKIKFPISRSRTTLHEVGHVMDGRHEDGGLMTGGTGTDPGSGMFSATSLKRFMLLRDQGP